MRGFQRAIAVFWSKTQKAGKDDCWLWTGRTDVDGYGCHCVGTTHTKAHRFSMMLHLKRELKSSELVCHRCDTPGCVNPGHLFIGTQKENQADKVQKNRQARGEICARSKLSETSIQQMRKKYRPGWFTIDDVAAFFGVAWSTASRAIKRQTWKHV